jgi:hypothetical protein
LVDPNSPFIDFLLPTDRVIGIEVNGQFIAVPHNILWWHEIANFDAFGLMVTYCPLTGSSMVFHRSNAQGVTFGVSGLLFNNNLVMFDRTGIDVDGDGEEEGSSLWPQMLGAAFCGPAEGTGLGMFPSIEIEWEDWLALHPETKVVSSRTGVGRTYTLYPYGRYEDLNNPQTLFPLVDADTRRPPKERVLGILARNGLGITFPFGALRAAAGSDVQLVVNYDLAGGGEGPGGADPMVVLWDGVAGAAIAFRPRTPTRDLTLQVVNGAFVDAETGSEWTIDGTAIAGPLQGQKLLPIPEAFVSFWFAFSQIFPNPAIWSG